MDQLDHSTRALVRQESKAPDTEKPKREAVNEFWSFRFTADKIGAVDQWIRVLDFVKTKFKGRFQLEKGTKHGILHYQGCFHCKPRERRSALVKELLILFPALEFPVKDYLAKSISIAADRYCMKTDTRIDGPWEHNMPREKISVEIEESDILQKEDMYPWGLALIAKVANCLPDKKDRTIYWYWSEQGCMKKTETARYLVYHHDAIIIQGGRKHVLANGYKNPSAIYILLVPRKDEGFVSYASIELLKDALYMSAFGTECTGSINRKKPWVIVFANFKPNFDAMSPDRWIVENVDNPLAGAEMTPSGGPCRGGLDDLLPTVVAIPDKN